VTGSKLKKSAHTTYQTWYHLVWIPKFRIPLLGRTVAKSLKEILQGIASRYGWEIDTMEAMDDHVHLFVSFPPRISIAKAIQVFKGISSRRLTEEFPKMEKRIWGAPIWARGYFVSTVNDRTTSQTIRRYIKKQKQEVKQLSLLK